MLSTARELHQHQADCQLALVKIVSKLPPPVHVICAFEYELNCGIITRAKKKTQIKYTPMRGRKTKIRNKLNDTFRTSSLSLFNGFRIRRIFKLSLSHTKNFVFGGSKHCYKESISFFLFLFFAFSSFFLSPFLSLFLSFAFLVNWFFELRLIIIIRSSPHFREIPTTISFSPSSSSLTECINECTYYTRQLLLYYI